MALQGHTPSLHLPQVLLLALMDAACAGAELVTMGRAGLSGACSRGDTYRHVLTFEALEAAASRRGLGGAFAHALLKHLDALVQRARGRALPQCNARANVYHAPGLVMHE